MSDVAARRWEMRRRLFRMRGGGARVVWAAEAVRTVAAAMGSSGRTGRRSLAALAWGGVGWAELCECAARIFSFLARGHARELILLVAVHAHTAKHEHIFAVHPHTATNKFFLHLFTITIQ